MGLYLLIPTILVLFASVLIVRAGAIALRMTGLDEKTAAFQSLSAFSMAGFTTKESELVVSHPQRRKIITWLIILGNAGILAAIVTATSSLTTSTDYKLAIALGVLLAGGVLTYLISRLSGLNRKWDQLVEKILRQRRYISQTPEVEHLLHFVDDYGIGGIILTEKYLSNLNPFLEKIKNGGLTVLGIQRKDTWISNPVLSEPVFNGDQLVIYGKLSVMEEISKN